MRIMAKKISIWAGLLVASVVSAFMSAQQTALDQAAGKGFSFGGSAALFEIAFTLTLGVYSAHLLLPQFKSKSLRDITVCVLGFVIFLVIAKVFSFIF